MTNFKQTLESAREHYQARRMLDAEAVLDPLVQSAPDYGEVFNLSGLTAYETGKYEKAEIFFKQAVNLNPGALFYRINLAQALIRLHKFDEAIAAFNRALDIDGNYALGRLHLAGLRFSLGNNDEAVEEFEKVLELEPDNANAFIGLVFSKKLPLDSDEVRHMMDMVETDQIPELDKAGILSALSKVYDQTGRYDQAFIHADLSNKIMAKLHPFDFEGYETTVEHIKDFFTRDFFEARFGKCGIASEAPLFILGMPRSGTSLVEQILSAHPKVYGGGELGLLGQLAYRINLTAPDTPIAQAMSSIDNKTANNLGTEYVDYLRYLSPEAERVTDKLSQNNVRLGLAALLLPKARVIHIKRNPMDTCVSCYLSHFAGILPHTFDLPGLASYYLAYESMMSHWKNVLPLKILEIEYEELVGRHEEKIREIIDFCELKWDEQCLSFYEQTRYVGTASQLQVKEPIHSKAVNRWKNYEKHLGDLKAVFEKP